MDRRVDTRLSGKAPSGLIGLWTGRREIGNRVNRGTRLFQAQWRSSPLSNRYLIRTPTLAFEKCWRESMEWGRYDHCRVGSHIRRPVSITEISFEFKNAWVLTDQSWDLSKVHFQFKIWGTRDYDLSDALEPTPIYAKMQHLQIDLARRLLPLQREESGSSFLTSS